MKSRDKSESIKVVMLCGGIGQRMFPISTDKSLLYFNGAPLIVHQINMAKKAGLKNFVIITNNANRTSIKSTLSKIRGIKLEYVNQSNAKGMANALLTASGLIGNTPFILVSSNDLFESTAYKLIIDAYRRPEKYFSYITALQVNEYFPGGYLKINSKHEIKGIIEKPARGREPSNLINIVLHLHTEPAELFAAMKKTSSRSDDQYEKTLNRMAAEKYKMKAVIYKDRWQAVKYPWHILEAMDFFKTGLKSHIPRNIKISDKATIDGSVYIENGVRILEGATVKGPCYIGANTIIGTNSLVRDSYIGSDTVVGFNTEIKHSYVGNNCWFHSNYIGDSVIEDDCAFGAGTVTANFRLDEDNVSVTMDGNKLDTGHDKLGTFIGRETRVGVNTSIMPGIRIGPNCVIGPQMLLNTDIEPDSMLFEKRGNLIVSKNRRRLQRDKRDNLKNKLVS